MNGSSSSKIPGATERMLARTGGLYIIIVLAIAQFIASPLGILIAIPAVQIGANLSSTQLYKAVIFVGSALLIRNILLLLGAYIFNREPITRLSKWVKAQPLEIGSQEEYQAWKKVTSLSWRYIAAAFTGLIFMALLPCIAYLRYYLGASVDQTIYVFFGGITAGLGIEMLELLIIDRLLLRVREILLPKGSEAQLTGISGLKIQLKFQIVVFALIIISVLLVVPIGYHWTVTVLYEEIGSNRVLADLQTQSFVASLFALLLGFGLTFIMSRSISQPIRQMIDSFKKVEEGSLKERVVVTATDEVGELAVYFNRMITRLERLQSGLEKQVADRTEQLKATIEVGHVVSSILNPDELIARVVNLITDRFGYYYAAIFLVDSTGHWALLKDATGEAGQALKDKKHRLEVGGKSMVGTVISTRQARIALDVGSEPVRFDNPLLPNTRSEIALPMIVGDQIIGALDVQSTQGAAFREESIDTLQGMVNQVAVALENARLFQETQRTLQELRAAHRLYVADAWSETAQEHKGYEYVATTEKTRSGPLGVAVNVPLTLRDQIIGQLHLEGSQEWTTEERNLIEAVALQAALALENARLLEESQQLALRERIIAEITGKIWSSPNMDLILQTAIKELGRALRADEATIELEVK